MQSNILAKLSGGDRKSPGLAEKVAGEICQTPQILPGLFEGIAAEDAILRARSSVALKFVAMRRPDLLAPFKNRIFEEMPAIDQWEVREQFCILITKLDLTELEIRSAFEIFNTNLNYYSSIVRTCAMQGLVDLVVLKPALKMDVAPVIRTLTETGTAAMRARGRKLLKTLEKI